MGGKTLSSRWQVGRERGIQKKSQEHITSAFCPRVKPYHSEAPTLPRCRASGIGTPEAAALVAARRDWPQPQPSGAASQDRASVPRPVRMETPPSLGSAAAPGPSAACRGPRFGPPTATAAWPTSSPLPGPPSSPAPSRKRAGGGQ